QPGDLRLRHFFDFYVIDQLYLEHPDVIVLTNILPDPINTYLAPYRGQIIDDINGKKIRTLDELAETFATPADRLVINMIGDGPPLVLDPKQVEAARERIKTRYNVVREENLQNNRARKRRQCRQNFRHAKIDPQRRVGFDYRDCGGREKGSRFASAEQRHQTKVALAGAGKRNRAALRLFSAMAKESAGVEARA